MIEQIPHCAADELHRTVGQNSRIHDPPEYLLREIGGDRCRLDDDRHSGQQRGAEFLQHSPDRKVESVDVDRRALERDADVLTGERTAL